MSVTYQHQLEVRGNNKILIPGCEPTSSLTSKTLSAYMASGKSCKNALVDLNDALAAIPGSSVKFGVNFNKGVRQKWFVLPPIDTSCPCDSHLDYYEILRNIPGSELPIESEFDYCDTMNMGYCPSSDFMDAEAPQANPYKDEGSFASGHGLLPPIPPWSVD